jgi:hypothetical protein
MPAFAAEAASRILPGRAAVEGREYLSKFSDTDKQRLRVADDSKATSSSHTSAERLMSAKAELQPRDG